jgi:hypothetical protein
MNNSPQWRSVVNGHRVLGPRVATPSDHSRFSRSSAKAVLASSTSPSKPARCGAISGHAWRRVALSNDRARTPVAGRPSFFTLLIVDCIETDESAKTHAPTAGPSLNSAKEGIAGFSRTARPPFADKVRHVVNINHATGIDVARGISDTSPLLKKE